MSPPRPASRLHVAGFLLALGVSFSSGARADLPPGPGTKYISYSFKVTGVDDAKGFVLLAYPCGTSSGVPTREMVVVTEARPVSVGRRGGGCPLYSMPSADFDAWKKAQPTPNAKVLDELFKSPKVRSCTGGPHASFTVDASDPRHEIVEALRVSRLDADGCVVASAPDTTSPATPVAAKTASPPTTEPTASSASPVAPTAPPADSTTTPPLPAEPTGGRRGCAGCTVGPRDRSIDGVLALLGGCGAWLGRRVRSRGRRSPSTSRATGEGPRLDGR